MLKLFFASVENLLLETNFSVIPSKEITYFVILFA